MEEFGIERRRSRRIPLATAVEILSTSSKGNSDPQVKTFYTQDISPQGIRVVTTGNLGIGDEVELQIYLPATTTILKARARIVRVDSHDDALLQHAVMVFEGLDPYGREILQRLYK